MRWVIHIGTQKTGSKAIQKFLCSEPDRIRDVSYFIPTAGRTGIWHLPLYEELLDGKINLLRALVTEASSVRAKFGIISFEALYELDATRIELLREHLGDAKIVLFIRRQDQLSNSFYNQLTMAHRIDYAYIQRYEASLLKYNPCFDHFETVKKWAKSFGSDNILVNAYDKKNNAISQFCTSLGFEANLEGYDLTNPNLAIDAEGMMLIREVKRNCPDPKFLPKLIRTAHEFLAEHFVDTYNDSNEQYFLTMEERRKIYAHYAKSNEKLKERYFPDREYLFPPLEPNIQARSESSVSLRKVKEIFKRADIAIGTTS